VTISGCLAPFCYCTYNNGHGSGSGLGGSNFRLGDGSQTGSFDDDTTAANCKGTVGPLKNWPTLDRSKFKCNADQSANCAMIVYANLGAPVPFASSKQGNPVSACVFRLSCWTWFDFFSFRVDIGGLLLGFVFGLLPAV
jgi:hypothetical protein